MTYYGRMMGSQIPTALGCHSCRLGEVTPGGYGPYLGEVTAGGYGPYLGNVFDDITEYAGKAAAISSQLSKVKEGKAKIAVLPSDRATITFPISGSPFGVTVPVLALALGIGGALFLVTRGGRRKG